MEFRLKYGRGEKRIAIPVKAEAVVLEPTPLPALRDLPRALDKALNSPLGAPGLDKRPAPKSVAIAVPDETKPLPTAYLLSVLLRRLFPAYPQLSPPKVSIVVSGGLHPPMGLKALDFWLPRKARMGCRVITHDARNSPLTHFDHTSYGTPVAVNSVYADAGLKLVLGQIDPHQFGGFTGGAKGVVVGCASAQAVEHNHGLMFNPGAWVGRLKDNPVRQDINEAGRMVGVDLAVNLVLDGNQKTVGLWAGEPEAVLAAGSEICAKLYGVALEEQYDMVVASCGGYPKDICLYQAQKGLNLASQALKPGGKIALLASCDQGVGDEVYYDYVRRFPDPQSALEDFETGGFRMGAHKCFLFSRTQTQFEVVIDSGLDEATLKNCHLAPGDAQEAITRWVAGFDGRPKVAVVPNANTTFFYPKNPGAKTQGFRLHNEGGKHMIQFLVHEKADTVGVATVDIKAGEVAKGLYMDTQEGIEIQAQNDIPLGHKIALQEHAEGDTVYKYGEDIGRVVASFKKGDHVHVHNLKTKRW